MLASARIEDMKTTSAKSKAVRTTADLAETLGITLEQYTQLVEDSSKAEAALRVPIHFSRQDNKGDRESESAPESPVAAASFQSRVERAAPSPSNLTGPRSNDVHHMHPSTYPSSAASPGPQPDYFHAPPHAAVSGQASHGVTQGNMAGRNPYTMQDASTHAATTGQAFNGITQGNMAGSNPHDVW